MPGSPAASVVLEAWRWTAHEDATALVLPDGCRDMILRVPAAGGARVWVSPRDDAARAVEVLRGDRFVGYRLHPAAVLDEASLRAAAKPEIVDDEAASRALLGAYARVDDDLCAAIEALAAAGSVASARKALRVTERTLERWLRARTERSPSWWQGLARARRAAAALDSGAPLAALATQHGYADQPHMTRAFRRWFRMSPAKLRQRPDLLAAAQSAGLDAATKR